MLITVAGEVGTKAGNYPKCTLLLILILILVKLLIFPGKSNTDDSGIFKEN